MNFYGNTFLLSLSVTFTFQLLHFQTSQYFLQTFLFLFRQWSLPIQTHLKRISLFSSPVRNRERKREEKVKKERRKSVPYFFNLVQLTLIFSLPLSLEDKQRETNRWKWWSCVRKVNRKTIVAFLLVFMIQILFPNHLSFSNLSSFE